MKTWCKLKVPVLLLFSIWADLRATDWYTILSFQTTYSPFREPWLGKKKKKYRVRWLHLCSQVSLQFTNVSWTLGIFLLCCCIGAGLHSYIISRLRAGNNCLMYFFILSNYHSAWQIIHVQCLFVEIKKTVLGHSNSTLHL